MDKLNIVIDTREQTPWSFDPARATVSVGTLKTGDYALKDDAGFGIERKSLGDFLGTIGTGWERFQRELDRMDEAGWPIKTIIVEGDYIACTFQVGANGELIPPQHRHPMLTPQFVEKRIAQLTMRGSSVIFAANPELAASLATAIFYQRNQLITNTKKNECKNRNSSNTQLQAG